MVKRSRRMANSMNRNRRLLLLLCIFCVIALGLAHTCTAPEGNTSVDSKAKGMFPAFINFALRPLSRLSGCKAFRSVGRIFPNKFVQASSVRLRGGRDQPFSSLQASAAAATAAEPSMSTNPLVSLEMFPRYDLVSAEHVLPAMQQLIKDAEGSLEKLEAKLKENEYQMKCVEFLAEVEKLSDHVERSWGVVQHLKGVKDNEALRKSVEEAQPAVVQFNLKLMQNEALFNTFKAIKDSKEFSSLTPAQKRIVETSIRDAELSGVALKGEEKKHYNELQQELATLSTKFSNNVLDSTKAFSVRLEKKEDVAGLPASALALAAQSAKAKGDKEATPEEGPWVFTLDMPSYLAVQQHAKDRSLREKMYEQYITRASKEGLDNTPIINKILALRQETAKLLGKRHHADVSTASKMATYESAMKLLKDLRESSYSFAKKELQELQAFAKSQGFEGELMPWDTTYYAERQREALYSFNEEEVRPYFSLPRVLDGLFQLANRLFDIEVVPAEGNSAVWNKDVQLWQINRDGKVAAYFYLDPYSRPEEKRGGAWMDVCAGRSRVMSSEKDGVRLPIAHMVCNQSPPVGDKPSLMTFREVETLFHEFGHALQHMLTSENEGLVAGIRGVEWDAVETPSQFMENWCYDKATIDKLAVHYETGKKMPDELWQKIKAAKNFRSGSMMLRQLQFAVTDLELHSNFNPSAADQPGKTVHDLYREVAKTYQVTDPMPYDRFLCAFGHIFSGGYSAGYYSYKWAEVLSADCFGAFEEVGLENEAKVKETGRRFRDTILGLGGGREPLEVFKMFRGREPKPDALLRHSGLVAA
uniref:oligopeptidase A n=1 Tax=Hanusia phi TaxID=3032 RepID=A0A7S0E0D4_9CRYP